MRLSVAAALLGAALAMASGPGRGTSAEPPTLLSPCPPRYRQSSAAEHRRIGTRCALHPRERLRRDFVPLGDDPDARLPGFAQEQRDSFPNAREHARGEPPYSLRSPRCGEVAYCRACRDALLRWRLRVHGMPR